MPGIGISACKASPLPLSLWILKILGEASLKKSTLLLFPVDGPSISPLLSFCPCALHSSWNCSLFVVFNILHTISYIRLCTHMATNLKRLCISEPDTHQIAPGYQLHVFARDRSWKWTTGDICFTPCFAKFQETSGWLLLETACWTASVFFSLLIAGLRTGVTLLHWRFQVLGFGAEGTFLGQKRGKDILKDRLQERGFLAPLLLQMWSEEHLESHHAPVKSTFYLSCFSAGTLQRFRKIQFLT